MADPPVLVAIEGSSTYTRVAYEGILKKDRVGIISSVSADTQWFGGLLPSKGLASLHVLVTSGDGGGAPLVGAVWVELEGVTTLRSLAESRGWVGPAIFIQIVSTPKALAKVMGKAADNSTVLAIGASLSPSGSTLSSAAIRAMVGTDAAAGHPELRVVAALLTSRNVADGALLDPPVPLSLMHSVFGAVVDACDSSHPTDSDRNAAALLCRDFAALPEGSERLHDDRLRGILGTLLDGDVAVRASIATDEKQRGGVAADGIVASELAVVGSEPIAVPLLVLEFKASRGTDPWFQSAAHYARYMPRRLIPGDPPTFTINAALLAAEPRLPCLLLDVTPGGVLVLRGAASVFPCAATEVLGCAVLATDAGSVLRVARLCAALRVGVAQLRARYGALAPLPPDHVPVPRALEPPGCIAPLPAVALPGGPQVSLALRAPVGGDRLVFIAATSALGAVGVGGGAAAGSCPGPAPPHLPETVIVKFARGAYGAAAHVAAAGAGVAPVLLAGPTRLPGGLQLVVMEHLRPQDGWALYDPASAGQVEAVQAAYHRGIGGARFVHGDLRSCNVLVRRAQAPGGVGDDDGAEGAASPPSPKRAATRWEVRFLDWDWAGREGEARYPMLNAALGPLYAAVGAASGELIRASHDVAMLALRGGEQRL